MGMLMFAMQSRSRRQLRSACRTEDLQHNLAILCGTDCAQAAHSDTLNHLMELLDPAGLGDLPFRMVHRLVRNKVLDKFRFMDMPLVAVDAVNVLSIAGTLAIPCRTQTRADGGQTSLCDVLEAKLVTRSGLALHLDCDFIDQPDAPSGKQDCERKAFVRLAASLRKRLPLTPLCLLMDGLYADQGVLSICEQNSWSYLITFKEGSIPSLWAEAQRRLAKGEGHLSTHRLPEGRVQTLRYLENLRYEGHHLHALYCDETDTDGKTRRFAYLTDIRPTPKTITTLINQGGRTRWKIENQGFNDQKNGGYKLDHAYGTGGHAWKNYYLLLQIVHTLIQLIDHSDLFSKLQRHLDPQAKSSPLRVYYQSLRGFLRRLGETFRLRRFSSLASDGHFAGSIQIRLDST